MANTSTNLPSTALNQGRRGNIAVSNIAREEIRMERDMEELILYARVDENGNLNNEDVKELQNHEEKMLRMKNKSSEAMHKRYQNLWHDYFCHKKTKDELKDVVLTAFFKSIKTKYAASTLWVIYSCINSYMIDQCGCNLRSLVRLTRHIPRNHESSLQNRSIKLLATVCVPR